ncbi:uncharacterized protein LOC131303505 [Rhododendron vialii]|uniref:uncharacterized protein LOC131303505 n=1 Tax=Rhododendron vialii TaxID=182163 RepID=UPI00265E811B|nr:uncharacterized protein LOC131303505 [Rhododendron vialii]
MGQAEVSLSNIFNRFLSIKRKYEEDSEDNLPLKKSNLAIRDGDSALITFPPSPIIHSPPTFYPATSVSFELSKGRPVKGDVGLRRSPRKKGVPRSRPSDLQLLEVNVAHEAEIPSVKANQDVDWNVQVLGRPLTFQILRGLCTTHCPLVVFLMETKNKRETLEGIRRRLHFSMCCYVDPVGLSGGLALWWKDEVDIKVKFKSKNIMRCIVNWPNHRNRWFCSFIYAPPVMQRRRELWDYLRSIHRESNFPWLCVGDFNEVGSILEKQGGGVCRRSRIEEFQQLLSDCELMDLEFKGSLYTWTNNQGGGANIRERLDRAVANID